MNDDYDSLLESILGALSTDNPRLREKLREGLERGLELATSTGQDVKVDIELEADGPGVTVLEGGGLSTEIGSPPDLEVIDGDGEGADDVRVQLMPHRTPDGLGHILVNGQQTVFRGAAPATYRIWCGTGPLEVLAEGLVIDTLETGQSIDVDASWIAVRGQGEGEYERV